MAKINEKALMNLPQDVKSLLTVGKYSLYTLPKDYADKGAYLLAVSRDATFFVTEEGVIGEAAGKLGSVKVEEVVRFQDAQARTSIKLNIA